MQQRDSILKNTLNMTSCFVESIDYKPKFYINHYGSGFQFLSVAKTSITTALNDAPLCRFHLQAAAITSVGFFNKCP